MLNVDADRENHTATSNESPILCKFPRYNMMKMVTTITAMVSTHLVYLPRVPRD